MPAVLLLVAGVVYAMLSASLPRRAGEAVLAGLAAPVAVELDARAVARIRAASLEDALRAQGFVHAQQRYFQMDLARRQAAGELAALFGPRALEIDRAQRVYAFRSRARELARRLPDRHHAWLEAYVAGVNAGLADLGARPPEYWLLGRAPERWTLEDSLLVLYSLYTTLSQNHVFERAQAVMSAALAPEVYEFLTPSTSRFDRPLAAPPDDPTGGYAPATVPGPDVVDLGRAPAPAPGPIRVDPPLDGAASNAWAVGPGRSVHGAAMIANDPHLELGLPSTFHRSELHWPGRAARGVGIPGVPGILLGATDRLAFGATVSYADQSDWVVLELDPDDASRYRVPGGYETFGYEGAEIDVAGRSAPERTRFRTTRWGPVVDADWQGRPLVLNATWLHPDGADLGVLELLVADDVDDGLDVLERWAGPSLSWLLADNEGRIAWIANGPVPERHGHDGAAPVSWADGSAGWRGLVAPPRLDAGGDAALFTANNRPLPRERAARLARGWRRPLRADRIAELLARQPSFDEHDFLEMQLDTRAAAYDMLRDIVLEVTGADESDPGLAAARRSVASWNGRADAAETGFRILQAYYVRLLDRVLGPLVMPAIEADPSFVYRWPLADEPLRRLLETRPEHLLTRGHADWPEFLRAVLADTLDRIESDPRGAGIDASWGEVNRLDAGHPFAGLPLIGRALRLPPTPQPGSPVSVRVAGPGRGAVARMAVSPARPERGYLQMIGGQSGHPLSPHFDDLHEDWRDGAPTPFLAGPTETAYGLVPRARPAGAR